MWWNTTFYFPANSQAKLNAELPKIHAEIISSTAIANNVLLEGEEAASYVPEVISQVRAKLSGIKKDCPLLL